METLVPEDYYKIVVPVFGAVKEQQFYTDLGRYQQC